MAGGSVNPESSKPKRKRKSRKRNPENKKLGCPDCSRKFYFKCQLDFHRLVHTGEKPYACDVCGKAFNTPYSLKNHKYIHTDEKPFKCAYCNYACRDSSTLRKHQANHTGDYTLFECKLCTKSFRRKFLLKAHVAETHLNVDLKQRPCPHCTKLFKSTSQLNTHIKLVHMLAKAGNCPICGLYITNIGNLDAHLSTHVDARPYACNEPGCDSTYKDRSSLGKHIRRKHRPERHYPCDICGFRRPTRRLLDRHVVTVHGKIKRVQCDHCGVRFYSKAYLINHIQKKHVRARKKFICDLCGFKTNNKPSLVMHIKYGHPSESDLECKICHTMYKKHTYLKAHYKRTHNICYKTKTRPTLVIKEEPPDDTASVHSIDLFEIDKTELEEELNLGPPETTAEPPALDTVVECERLVTVPQDVFDEFYVQHVTKIQPHDRNTAKESTETISNGRVDKKALEFVKKTKVKMLAEARQKQAMLSIEKARQIYNEKMMKYVAKNAAEAESKQPIKIKLFKMKDAKVYKIEDTKRPDVLVESKHDVVANEISNDDKNGKTTDDDIDHNDKKCNDENNDDVDVDATRNFDESKHDVVANEVSNDDKNEKTTDDDIDDNDKKCNDEKNDDDNVDATRNSDDGDDTDDNYRKCKRKKRQKKSKINFNSHQCYICFKLFDTKENLLDHCKNHFDVCNERFLKKCPLCPYVTKVSIGTHLRLKHGVNVKLPYGRIQDKKDNNNGCRYYFELDDPLVHKMEVIPSVKNLNKIASMKIDKKRREDKDKMLYKTKLVRKGEEWVVETEKISISGDVTMPEFNTDVVKNVDKIGDSDAYLDGLKKMSHIAKKSGKSMLFPCQCCDKVCRNFAALKLHNRKHEANPKPFKKKVWKHKLKGNPVEKKPTKAVQPATDNRTAKPKPIKNKHKCDPKLKTFYENNIKGSDIEFWQFLKIFNKMGRDNITDFKDLESRHEYGIVLPEDKHENNEPTEETANEEVSSTTNPDNSKNGRKLKKLPKIKIRLRKDRRIQLHNKRNLIRQALRQKIAESSKARTAIDNEFIHQTDS